MWESLRETRYLDCARHTLDRVECRCLSLDIRIGRDDHLIYLGIRKYTLKKRTIIELVWSDSLDRRHCTTEHVIESAIYPSPLDREEVEIVLDDAERMSIPLRVRAYRADRMLHIRHTMAAFTFSHFLMEITQCL